MFIIHSNLLKNKQESYLFVYLKMTNLIKY